MMRNPMMGGMMGRPMGNPMGNPMMAGPQLMQNIQQLKANPLQFLMKRGFNIPDEVGTDPQNILNHLMKSGQVTQEQINSVYQVAQKFR